MTWLRLLGNKLSGTYSTRQKLTIITGSMVFLLSILHYALYPDLLPDTLSALSTTTTTTTTTRTANPVSPPRREAYVTFLSGPSVEYFDSARMLLFALQHDPLTADPSRPFVVLTIPAVPQAFVRQLAAEGAVVVQKPTIDGLPSVRTLERWKNVYSKLHVFNMTEYDRVVFYDADHLILHPVDSIWYAPGADAPHGLAALGSGEGGYVAESDYFLAGFFVARPGEEMMRGLMAERGYDPVYPEQNLMNSFFRQDGPRPWSRLDPIHERISPKYEHVLEGAHTIHEKCWWDGIDHRISQLYHERLGRMEGYWLGKAAAAAKAEGMEQA